MLIALTGSLDAQRLNWNATCIVLQINREFLSGYGVVSYRRGDARAGVPVGRAAGPCRWPIANNYLEEMLIFSCCLNGGELLEEC